jgi:hypothetical protein
MPRLAADSEFIFMSTVFALMGITINNAAGIAVMVPAMFPTTIPVSAYNDVVPIPVQVVIEPAAERGADEEGGLDATDVNVSPVVDGHFNDVRDGLNADSIVHDDHALLRSALQRTDGKSHITETLD